MDPIRTRQELKRAIDGAWSAYESRLKELGKAIDPAWELHGLASAHVFIGPPAEDAYVAFQAEQDRISALFGSFHDAPYLVTQARKAYEIAVHNAEALIVAAQSTYDQTHLHLERVRAGAWKQYGITEPEAYELQNEADDLAALEAAKAALGPVTEQATAKLDAELVILEKIRAGVTTGTAEELPVDLGPLNTPQRRRQAILEAVHTYTGPLYRGLPKIRGEDGFRAHSLIRDVRRRDLKGLEGQL